MPAQQQAPNVGRYFKVTQSDKIITVVRRYCLDLLKDGLSTQQSIAIGLLNGVEFLVGKQFSNNNNLKAEIKHLALANLKEQTSGYFRKGHLKKIELEKQNFLHFIDQLDAVSPDNVQPLPYRRRLSGSEAVAIRQGLNEKFNFDGWDLPNYYWEPLASSSSKPFYFYNTENLDDQDYQNITSILLKIVGDMIYEVTENGLDYEIETAEFDKDSTETAYTGKENNWIIYLSHEGTIAFGGYELMKGLDTALADKIELKNKW